MTAPDGRNTAHKAAFQLFCFCLCMQSDWNWKCIQEKVRWIAQFEMIRDDKIWWWLLDATIGWWRGMKWCEMTWSDGGWLVERKFPPHPHFCLHFLSMLHRNWMLLVSGVHPTLMQRNECNAMNAIVEWMQCCNECNAMNAILEWIPYWNEFTTSSLLTLAILFPVQWTELIKNCACEQGSEG